MKAVDRVFPFGCEGVPLLVSNHALNWGGVTFEKVVVDMEDDVLYDDVKVSSREVVCRVQGNFFGFRSSGHVVDKERE